MLDSIRKNHLEEFLDLCTSISPSISKTEMTEYINKTFRYYKGNKELKEELRDLQELEKRWYASLETGIPDYSVYDDVFFLCEAWCCWKIYSREYLKKIIKAGIVDDMKESGISSIVDIGCGIGYTTCSLKEIFPDCKVYGINIEDSFQYKLCKILEGEHDINIIPDIKSIKGSVDLVFASEYFEHIENAVEHLEDIINTLKPKYFIIANSFTAKSVGHFNIFKYKGEEYDGKQTSKLFNKILTENNYEKQKYKLWNNRPSYWKLKTE